jgi:hypothetical protein
LKNKNFLEKTMSAQLVRKTLRGSDFQRIDWQKEFKVTPAQFFTITVIKVEEEQAKVVQATSNNTVEVEAKGYELEMSPDLPMTEANMMLGGFDFLKNEPDIYSVEDLKKRYV